MSYNYDKTHENILKSAKKQFLEKGFRDASIRTICKEAGVTNGAFYAHYKSKEDLFNSIVDPFLKEFKGMYSGEDEAFFTINNSEDIINIFRESYKVTDMMIHYICEHREIFLLLLDSSAGTRYENFQNKIIDEETNSMKDFLNNCKPYVKNPENISTRIIQLGSSFLISTIFHSFKKGKSAEEILQESRVVSEFCIGGYKQLLGI